MNSRRFRLILSILWLAIMSMAVTAQATDSGRIYRSQVSTDGNVIIQVSIPRGRNIESAGLKIGSEVVNLTASPVNLQSTQWLVVDAGANVINIAPAIQTGLLRFIRGIDQDTRVGIIYVNDELTVFQPTNKSSELTDIINSYSVSASDISCIADALNYLANMEHPDGEAWNVMLIAGERTRQSLCLSEDVTDFVAPIDVLYTSDEASDWYLNLIEQTGGEIKTSNIQTIETRINEIKSIWVDPVFSVVGKLNSSIQDGERGRLSLTLNNDDEMMLPVRMDVNQQVIVQVSGLSTVAAPLPTVAVVTNNIDTASRNQAEPTTQFVTDVPLSTAMPMNQSVDVLPTSVTFPTSVPSNVNTTSNTVATDVPITSPTTAVIAVVANPTGVPANTLLSVDSPPDASQTTSTDDTVIVQDEEPTPPVQQASDWINQAYNLLPEDVRTQIPVDIFPIILGIVLVVGGILVLIIAVLILRTIGRLLVGGKKKKPQPVADKLSDNTVIEDIISPGGEPAPSVNPSLDYTLLEFTEHGNPNHATPATNDDMDMTMMDFDDDEDPLDRTQLVTETEFLQSTNQLIVGYLIDNQTQEQFEIHRTGTMLGRQSTADIVINDQLISRSHLRFFSEDGTLWMEILTGNPISRNNDLVRGRIQLQSEDILQISPQHQFTFVAAVAEPTSELTDEK